jgi:hypothetical protein
MKSGNRKRVNSAPARISGTGSSEARSQGKTKRARALSNGDKRNELSDDESVRRPNKDDELSQEEISQERYIDLKEFGKKRREARKEELQKLEKLNLVKRPNENDPSEAAVNKRQQRQILETHLAQPKLTSNMREALQLADELSIKGEKLARGKVEKRLKEMGFNLEANSDLYDRIVSRLQQSPLTINLRTNILEDLMRGGGYLNQWERSINPKVGDKSYYGNGRIRKCRRSR